MTIWAEFTPLKKCVVGTLPDADQILPHTNLTNRYKKYFTEIINTSKKELDQLAKTLNDLGVQTSRSKQHYPIHNGHTITTPPLAVRDIFSVYGDGLFKGNFACEWNKDVPDSCNHVLESMKFDSVTKLPTNDIFFDGDFTTFDPDKDLNRPLFHPPMSLRIGNDIVIAKRYGREGNDLGKDAYIDWLRSINPSVRIHTIDTESHIDSQIFLVRPGLLITCLQDNKLPEYFDKWEKIKVEAVTSQALHKKNRYRHKKFHPVIAQSFYNFLETCTEETYFDINSLSVNENTVLFTGRHTELFRKLERRNVNCVAISMKATTFWDTGVHCATNELEREGTLEDYA